MYFNISKVDLISNIYLKTIAYRFVWLKNCMISNSDAILSFIFLVFKLFKRVKCKELRGGVLKSNKIDCLMWKQKLFLEFCWFTELEMFSMEGNNLFFNVIRANIVWSYRENPPVISAMKIGCKITIQLRYCWELCKKQLLNFGFYIQLRQFN